MNDAAHTDDTRAAYDALAPVWSATTDEGPFNGLLERPALRSLVPRPLDGQTVLDAGCGSGAQCEWLLDRGATVLGMDLSPRMIEQAERRCGGRATFFVADLAEPLALEANSLDGVTCSLVLHYLRDWTVPLASLAAALRPGGWFVVSLDHPFAPALPDERGGYFATRPVSDTWEKGGVTVTQRFWRRPLGAVVDAFADAGLLVERVVEAHPSAEALERFPDELGSADGTPSFIVYRLRKPASERSRPSRRSS